MNLPLPPFKAITRRGLVVTVISTTGPKHLLGRSFPIVGRFLDKRTVMSGETRTWQADGRFALNVDDAHDLVEIVTEQSTTPFPKPSTGLTHQPGPSVPESNTKEIAMAKLINSILVAALTETQAAIINQARTHSSVDERKQIKREVFAVVKAKFGIPDGIGLRANTTGVGQPGYLVLHTGKKVRKNHVAAGMAFRLGTDGKFNGQYASATDLFPPPAPVQAAAAATDVAQGSVFGGTQSGSWFRLDASQVAAALTTDFDDLADSHSQVQPDGMAVDLPVPHLMLAGRTDLAITADGSIYRKA